MLEIWPGRLGPGCWSLMGLPSEASPFPIELLSIESDSPPVPARTARRRSRIVARAPAIEPTIPESVALAAAVITAGLRVGACALPADVLAAPRIWVPGGDQAAQLANGLLSAGYVTGRVREPA